LKNTITTSTTPETLEDSDRKFFSTSSQPYFDDSSLFAKTRDDRKIGGSTEDLANTAVVAIHTLATAPPSNYEFSKNACIHILYLYAILANATVKNMILTPLSDV